ncbi:MAG: hypothetical protein ACR2PB_11145, partial [Desulfocapsaceae bacterium]
RCKSLIISGITIGKRVLPNPNEMPVSKTQTMLITKGWTKDDSELLEEVLDMIYKRRGSTHHRIDDNQYKRLAIRIKVL